MSEGLVFQVLSHEQRTIFVDLACAIIYFCSCSALLQDPLLLLLYHSI